MIRNALKLAWRTGKYFKLHPAERAILWLASKIVTRVKSETLKELLLKIFDKISHKLTLKIKAYMIGIEIAKRHIEIALKFGYVKAIKWLKDPTYIFYLGISYLNTSPIYQVM